MADIHGKKIKLFTLSASKKLGAEIAEKLGISLSELTVTRFADGEVSIDIKETVRGHDVFVIQSTNAPVNENYMELLITIDALKRASAKSINIVMPYYGYARQERKALPRQPISARLMADLLQVAGADRVVCIDLHAAQIQGFFDIPIDNMLASPILAKYIDEKNIQDLCVVSPDHGGTTRARKFAEFFNAPLAIMDKRRIGPNQVGQMTVLGDVKDKNVVVIDDMVDTGGTICLACEKLKESGAKSIIVCCTHPVLSGPACERLQNSSIDEFVCTNTIELPESKKFPKLTQLSCGDLLAHAILNIIDSQSISVLFDYDAKHKVQ